MTLDIIASRSIPEPNTGCWLWLFGVNEHGYGRMHFNGKNRHAHRVCYEIENGPIPPGMVVMHKCDVPCCVNPDHLSVGTQLENIEDCRRKGRSRSEKKLVALRSKPPKTELHRQHIALSKTPLTVEQIKAIRVDARSDRIIAAEYGVKPGAVQRIQAGTAFAFLFEGED